MTVSNKMRFVEFDSFFISCFKGLKGVLNPGLGLGLGGYDDDEIMAQSRLTLTLTLTLTHR